MWFGDLVTMQWWNGIWLNEAFATLMELLCVDAFRPEWQRWVSFGVERDAGHGHRRPALHPARRVPRRAPRGGPGHVRRPHLPEGRGRAAHARAVPRGRTASATASASTSNAHRFGNTETADLWDAIEAASGEPVRDIMDTWILQGGFPLVTVGRPGRRRHGR